MIAERAELSSVKPGIYNPLFELTDQIKQSSLTTTEFFLIEIRASQINGCAFCVQKHTKEAIENGEKQYRIHALPYWEDSPFFSEEEKVLIQMTEEITLIAKKGLSDEVYDKAVQAFGKEKVADIIMAIACINAWNRIGRSTLMVPEPSQN
ncbi:MAG: carboxymuconolactone decarboxylase family protein [Flammeovirgaceae bacterium]|nr:carboxymuconolactone decarboxylase family protein [Flammeovirgaceae bacterium]